MHVDLVAPHYRPVVGGIETHVAALAHRARDRGHDVTVHARDRNPLGRRLPDSETIDGILVRRWPTKTRLGYYATRCRPRLAGDLIHLHAYGTWTNDWVTREYSAAPKVLTLHHGLEIPAPTPVHRLYQWFHMRTRGRGTLDRLQAVIVNTQLDVERFERMGYPLDRVHVIPGGIPDVAYEPPTADPAPTVEPYFVYVGRLHREKSLDHALQALSRLPEGGGLVVVGPDAGSGQHLRRLATRLGIADRVRFEGEVPEPAKRAWIAGARALVLPSRYESLGFVLLEAWAQGVPVVASRVGAVPRLVEDGKDGLLYPWGDIGALTQCLQSLCTDSALARRLGAAGRPKAQDFRETPLADRVVDLYETLVPPGS